jgi:hypothetical protein
MSNIICLIALCILFILTVYGIFTMDSRKDIWYVRYPDGHRTYCMPKSEAEGYREIFGGVVYKSTKVN